MISPAPQVAALLARGAQLDLALVARNPANPARFEEADNIWRVPGSGPTGDWSRYLIQCFYFPEITGKFPSFGILFPSFGKANWEIFPTFEKMHICSILFLYCIR